VLYEQPRDGSLARDRAAFASPAMIFTPQGLMLGAGTILAPADGIRKLESLKDREQGVLALLSAAYSTAVAPSVLTNIERAAKSWSEGDDCGAHIHLAHTGLYPLDDFQRAAYRLRMARGALEHGASPRAVFEALHLDARYIDTLEKLYNQEQPRVPAGSGRISGQWTRFLSWMAGLNAADVVELGLFAARVARIATPVGGAAAVFGLLFVPSPNNVHVEGEVPEIPGLRYSWNRDEASLLLTYDRPGGAKRTVALRIKDGDVLDEDGRVVGKVVGGNKIAIDTVAVLPDLVKQDEPRLCPAYQPDRPGSDRGKTYEEDRARRYEDFVKFLINPPPLGPTPSGYVYYLPNPKENGKPVSYDDCEWKTGRIMFEIKGETNAKLLTESYSENNVKDDILNQSARQINASGGRPIVWVFAGRGGTNCTSSGMMRTSPIRTMATTRSQPESPLCSGYRSSNLRTSALRDRLLANY
jgi:hypothetical protein